MDDMNSRHLRRVNGGPFVFLGLFFALLALCSGTVDSHELKTQAGDTIRKFSAVDSPGVLNVHVVPHTHDDVGWKKTVEQYFYGLNMTIDTRGHVKSIISTSLESVLQNPARTFVYVESKFFSMWWNQASDAQKESMRYVISGSKQWTFANGGWSMHDEACTHYIGMIDQTTTGHDFLKRHLGVVPKVAWQLDPFGHSATQAHLMTHKMGMNAIYFGRLDYEDLELRKLERRCEGLWKPKRDEPNSNHTTVDSSVFFSLTGGYSGNYNPPGVKDFMFDELYEKKWNVVPLTKLNETELHAKLEWFLELLAIQASQTNPNSSDILLTMGTDFTYRQAESYFSNLDLLIHMITLGQDWGLWNLTRIFEGLDIQRVNIFYSTPDYYTSRKYHQTKEAAIQETKSSTESLWTTKADDFFPYSDRPHGFWSGYFTSRTAFKRFERVASGFLLAARQLDLLFNNSHDGYTAETHPLFELEDALGVVQHHDAVSGTGKQHVADDYSKRVQAGVDKATNHVLGIILDQLFAAKNKDQTSSELQSSLRETLQYCPLLMNESKCEAATNTDFGSAQDMYVVIYNPTYQQKAQTGSWTVRVPVSKAGTYVVERLGDSILNKLNRKIRVRAGKRDVGRDEQDKGAFESFWQVEFIAGPLVALGACTYRLSLESSLSANEGLEQKPSDLIQYFDDTVKVTNGRGMIALFDRHSGRLQTVLDQYNHNEDAFGIDLQMNTEWGYYTSYNNDTDDSTDSEDDGQSSGAYIFRPSSPNQTLHTLPPCVAKNDVDAVKFVPTDIGLEVHTAFGESGDCWIRQIVRVVKDQPWIEVEYKVGPVPIHDGHGKEVVARFWAPTLDNEGVFYTDSNARAFMKRVRDYRPSWNLTKSFEPIAGNYYPINAAIYMEDANASLAILTDRARGGGSILDGSLEVKVQRRTIVDDHRGVDEPLNETTHGMSPYPPYGDARRIGEGVAVSGVLRVMVGGGLSGARLSRSVMDEIFAQPIIFVGSAPSSSNVDTKISRRLKGLSDQAEFSIPHPSFSVLSKTSAKLPPNVFLATLKRLYDYAPSNGTSSLLLIRLAHQYSPGEDDAVMSKPVQVNLQTILDPSVHKVVSVTERTLSGNQNWTSFVATKYNWTEPILSNEVGNRGSRGGSGDDRDSTTFTLQPLDIRTFHVLVDLPEAPPTGFNTNTATYR